MSYFKLFNNSKHTKTNDIIKENNNVTEDDIFESGMPIISKDGYFWDMHKHDKSMELINGFLPHNHEYMCHLELYNYLKTSGIIQHVCIDNFVIKYVRKHIGKVKLFLDMAHSASTQLKSRRMVYQPYSLIEPENVRKSLVKENIDALIEGVKNNTFKTDLDIVNAFGFLVYQHFKFHLSQFDKVDMIEVTDTFSTPSDNVEHIFEILYPSKTKHSGKYLFHGSAYHNWYNIMLNGLKVPSSAADVVNGQAYGLAIYTGLSASISSKYCTTSSVNYGYVIMGIVQTSDKSAFSSSSMKTFTVDSDVTLRYLIISNNKCFQSNIVIIDKISSLFPKNQTNDKVEDELFGMNEFDESNIVKIGETTVVNDIPYIELEDGTRLYDQQSLLETYKVSDTTIPMEVDNTKLEININKYMKRKNNYNIFGYAKHYYNNLNESHKVTYVSG